ncbi:tuberin [Leptidea sinapis]|uniref:tuberin n=1 Tax=Leptidea sinapis TaxID=189913 RepID=UPI0021C44AC8|nr:tuberin [Leptidea sinapis]
MSSRDRDTKSLQDKLKVFFKKGASAPLAAQNELVVTADLRKELSPESPLSRRLRAVKELGDKVLHIRVQDGGVEKIWACIRDLLEDVNIEGRHAALGLLRCIAEGQTELLIMRTILFRFLRETHSTHPPEDYQLRFKLLNTLTNTGKDIKCFEEQIGPFLLEWLPQLQSTAHIIDFVQLITNVVKFNAVYLDEEIVHGIVNNSCHLCVYSADSGVVLGCLSLLEAVVSYSLLPRTALPTFVAALCRTVNVEHYCQNSWKLMRNVMGADLGHAALQELVEMLRGEGGAGGQGGAGREAEGEGGGLLRGAVFYINMALWGPRRVHSLHVSPLAVLPAFLKALGGRQAVVTYEVVVSLQSLVARAPLDLHELCWDVLLDIVRAVLHHDKSFDPPNELIHSRVHALITTLEQLQDAGQFQGDPDSLLDLIDYCGHDRPESSTVRLVSLRGAALGGPGDAGAALALVERYLRQEPRLPVRLHTLHTVLAYIKRNRYTGGEELVERVGAAALTACAADAEAPLRAAAARAAPDLLRACGATLAVDLIDQLEKILNRPFEVYVSDVCIGAESDTSDVSGAAGALLEVLHERLAGPAAPPARALLVLLDHLALHYRRAALLHHHPRARLQILEMLFALRANPLNCVGFCYEESGAVVWGAAAARLRPTCSPLLLVEPPAARNQAPPPRDLPPGACLIPVGRCARALVAALGCESEWSVLAHVLRALPQLLAARAPALGRRAQDLDVLAGSLCAMLADRGGAPACVRAHPTLLLSDFHALVLPALAAMSSYHAYLEPPTQQRIVRCLLKYGMVLRTPQQYIMALTAFALETRDTMVRMLPEVLLDLSKISDTKAIASPMLEFLSTLTRLPRVFASFVEDQYMSVFAILLPYTNPSRYNHYVVSLAHHVIAAWFLKCRLSYRRNFVRFIIHGLHNYIIMPFEEQLQYKSNVHQSSANEDSSNRQRSSSLGSKAVSRAPLSGKVAGQGAPAAFHVELTETCVDLLARYTFTPCSVKPQRSERTDGLFNGGQSTTWLVGHKLVTITTSGCLQSAARRALCDRCSATCCQAASDDLSATAAAPHVQVRDSSESNGSSSNHLHPEVKRQNSSENKSSDPFMDFLSSCNLRIDKISKEVVEEGVWALGTGGGGGGAEGGACECWCARWAQLHVRSATGDVSWLLRMQNHGGAEGGACECWCARWAQLHVRSATGDVSWLLRMQNHITASQLQECDLQDMLTVISPPLAAGVNNVAVGGPLANNTGAGAPGGHNMAAGAPGGKPASAQLTTHAASATDLATEESKLNRQTQQHATDLHKSSSDSVVASDRLQASPGAPRPHPARISTQPINIPGSPQRTSAPADAADIDVLLFATEGKSRHPVRRSNSSPEMSTSWKLTSREPPSPAPCPAPAPSARPYLELADPEEMILLPSCEPTSASMTMHACKKAAKKSDMRVSCEAIPEEMSGTSPQPLPLVQKSEQQNKQHPHLLTYNSDPGNASSDGDGESATDKDNHVARADTPSGGVHSTHHHLQKTSSDSTVGATGAGLRDELPPLARSKRSNTISVMSPTDRTREPISRPGSGCSSSSGGVAPSFVFLQLYHNMSTYPISPPVPGEAPPMVSAGAERPLKVTGAQHLRTLKNIDLVPPLETYKVGVLYVGPGQQDDEVAILKNEYGSVRYCEFLRALGTLVPLEEAAVQESNLFLNLETGGKDGRYTYVWTDDIMQVLFHVATAMPCWPRDPNCNEKLKYIGNDYVSIVFNDSGHDFNILTIKGQFNLCVVVVEPLEGGVCRVLVKTKDERIRTKFLAHLQPITLSDGCAPLLARQQALHCALASQISQSLEQRGGAPYASNCLERLRLIKRLRARVEGERRAAAARAPAPYHASPHSAHTQRRVAIDDFNDYT